VFCSPGVTGPILSVIYGDGAAHSEDPRLVERFEPVGASTVRYDPLEAHFTSVTGTLTRWTTLEATEPSTMAPTAPSPRVPITTASARCSST